MDRRLVEDFCARLNWLDGHAGEVELVQADELNSAIIFSNEDGTREFFVRWDYDTKQFAVFGMGDY